MRKFVMLTLLKLKAILKFIKLKKMNEKEKIDEKMGN